MLVSEFDGQIELDIGVSMFVSAATSLRAESVLRPFPPAYLHHGRNDLAYQPMD